MHFNDKDFEHEIVTNIFTMNLVHVYSLKYIVHGSYLCLKQKKTAEKLRNVQSVY